MKLASLVWAIVIGVVIGASAPAARAADKPADRLTPAPSKVGIVPKYVLGIHGTITPEGVLITKVVTGTVADQFGLKPGDWILAVNRVTVNDSDAGALAINDSEGEALLLVRSGETGALMQLEAKLPKAVLPLTEPPMPVKPRPRP